MNLKDIQDGVMDRNLINKITFGYIDYIGKRKMSKMAKIPEKTIYNFKDKKHKTLSENIFKWYCQNSQLF